MRVTWRRIPDLRPHLDVRCVTYDWVHTMLQHGVLVVESECMLSRCSGIGINRETIRMFLKDEAWIFPHASARQQRQLHRIFDERRASDQNSDQLRCTCSELLGAYGMLRLVFGFGSSATLRVQTSSLCDCVALGYSDLVAGPFPSEKSGRPRLLRLGRFRLSSNC